MVKRPQADSGNDGSSEMASALLLWIGPPHLSARLPLAPILQSLPDVSRVSELRSVSYAMLKKSLDCGRPPDAVLSPLFWRGGDATETAGFLRSLGYDGAYRIVSPRLPRPEIVVGELRVICPETDIQIVEMPELSWLAA